MSDKELEEILNQFSTTREKREPIKPEPIEETQPKAEKNDLSNLSFDNFIEAPARREPEKEADEMVELKKVAKKGRKPSKNVIAVIIALVVAIAACVGGYFVFFHGGDKQAPEKAKTPAEVAELVQPEKTTDNPLTGESGYNEGAVGKRPVAVVVENEYSTEAVRPQWALSEADIVLEGESEFSTRLLLFWADYTSVPEKVGPARSARPPFIHFSQLFDAVFIHAGMSKSKGNYVGASEVFEKEKIDHVNLLANAGYAYFDRDNSRQTAVEHTGYLKGDKVSDLMDKMQFRTDINDNRFSVLQFNDEPTAMSELPAKNIEFKWTKTGRCPKTGKFFYDEEAKKYSTTDFDSKYGKSGVQWENLVFLLDRTEYVVKENYKHGKSETYCNYKLSGGKGAVVSQGTYVEITWGVSDGKLWMKDAQGNDVKLNKGKTYIGYGSSNYEGYYNITE